MPYRVVNIVRKGETDGYKQFLLSHNVLYSYISLAHQNVALCGNGLGQFQHFRSYSGG